MREDWVECELGDLLKVKNGFAFKSKAFDNSGVPVIRIGDISNWVVGISEAKCIQENIEFDDYQVRNGDILIAMSGATTGKFGVYISDEKAYQNQRVGNLIPHNDNFINRKFIFYTLYALKFEIEKVSYGGAQPNISSKKIEELTTSLAPLPIQRAIVNKIETLFTALDKGIEDLKKAQDQLIIYRQAVLKKAFERELINKYDISVDHTGTPETVKLGDIADMCLGKMLDKKKNIGEFKPYLGNINVRWGQFDLANLKEMKFEPEEKGRFLIQKNDLIICEGGEPGRCAVWDSDNDMFIQKALHRVRLYNEWDSYFIYYYIFYLAHTDGLSRYFTGTTIKHLTGRKLRELIIPFFKLKEQHQIVKEIETRLSVCDQVEEDIKRSLEKSEALRQSILKKAFEGKLLSEQEIAQCKLEEDYEPAGVLLRRIEQNRNEKVKSKTK